MFLLFLAACTGTDSGAEPVVYADCDAATTCCNETRPALAMAFQLGVDEALVGTFDQWGEAGITFVPTSGAPMDVWAFSDQGAFEGLPDLAAAGEVTVTAQGEVSEGGIETSVHVAGESGDTLLLVGAGPVTDLGGWTVEAGPDVTTCGALLGDPCNEYVHQRPVTVSRGDDGVVLWQAEEATFGPHYTVRVNRSQSGSGEYQCLDGPGSEYTRYTIVGPG